MTTPATAVITGASSGIGAATAHALGHAGFSLLLGARRLELVQGVAQSVSATSGVMATARRLDVTDTASVEEFAAGVEEVGVLVTNAGGALGLDPVEKFDEEQWRWMYDANVLGVARTVRAFLPALRRSGDGRVVVVTSVAGHQTYAGGAGYTAAKFAAAAVTDTLRLELLGEPIRVIEIAPGMVETDFSAVRFDGDTERAAGVYRGVETLKAEDVADAIAWTVTRPSHVSVSRLDLRPRDQATARDLHRRES